MFFVCGSARGQVEGQCVVDVVVDCCSEPVFQVVREVVVVKDWTGKWTVVAGNGEVAEMEDFIELVFHCG